MIATALTALVATSAAAASESADDAVEAVRDRPAIDITASDVTATDPEAEGAPAVRIDVGRIDIGAGSLIARAGSGTVLQCYAAEDNPSRQCGGACGDPRSPRKEWATVAEGLQVEPFDRASMEQPDALPDETTLRRRGTILAFIRHILC